jgi:hypothetical protein
MSIIWYLCPGRVPSVLVALSLSLSGCGQPGSKADAVSAGEMASTTAATGPADTLTSSTTAGAPGPTTTDAGSFFENVPCGFELHLYCLEQ